VANFAFSILPFLFEEGQEERIQRKKNYVSRKISSSQRLVKVVAVYSPILQPTCFEYLIRMLRDLNPCVMVLIKVEVEADNNSPTFLDCFNEALNILLE